MLVDLDRTTHAISGTAVRENPSANWHRPQAPVSTSVRSGRHADSLVWTVDDIEDVVREQERRIAAETAPLVIAGNDAFAATVWGERYLGFRPNVFAGTPPDLYPLTDHVGVPFEQDGWRGLFERELARRGVPGAK